MRRISRRSFLAATGGVALGGPVLLSACGGGGGGGGGGGDELEGADVVGRWNTYVLVPGALRLPAAFGKDGVFFTDGPSEVSGTIVDSSGTVVAADLRATKHNAGIPNAYWPFAATITAPGIYQLLVDGASEQGQAFQVFDDAEVRIPKVGEALPPFDTPTVEAPGGVDPICTATPPCPLHEITLTDALATGKPVAYLIGTPAHCQTAFCGPILDLLLDLREEFADRVEFVHAEVYTDDTISTPAPAITAYQLDFEPLLYVADAGGTITTRLDAAFDQAEMRDAIAAVAG